MMYYPAKNQKHKLLVVMLHCLGGHTKQLKRHIAFLNSAGFSVSTYLAFGHSRGGRGELQSFDSLPEATSLKQKHSQQTEFSVRSFVSALKNKKEVLEIWREELNQHLKGLPKGPKVIFSLSLPSVSALLSISYRKDIKALICDGGPFLHFPVCVYRLFSCYYKIPSLWLKLYLSMQMMWCFRSLLWGRVTKKIFLPKNFPILSLRGAKDQQVHPADIHLFLKKIKVTKPQVCLLKHSDHLKGLKTEPKLYTQTVLSFLYKINQDL